MSSEARSGVSMCKLEVKCSKHRERIFIRARKNRTSSSVLLPLLVFNDTWATPSGEVSLSSCYFRWHYRSMALWGQWTLQSRWWIRHTGSSQLSLLRLRYQAYMSRGVDLELYGDCRRLGLLYQRRREYIVCVCLVVCGGKRFSSAKVLREYLVNSWAWDAESLPPNRPSLGLINKQGYPGSTNDLKNSVPGLWILW